jgi:hypothetical protein
MEYTIDEWIRGCSEMLGYNAPSDPCTFFDAMINVASSVKYLT